MFDYINRNKSWFYTFVLLCFSGNPLFSYEPKTMVIGAITVLALFIFSSRSFSSDVVEFACFYLFLLLIQALIIPEFKISASGFFVIKLAIGLLLIQMIGSNFCKIYIDVIWILSICSLVLFVYNTLFGLIPGFPCAKYGVSLVIYTQLFGESVLPRNCGMFWEPGAYAGYLDLALLFCLITKQNNPKFLVPIIVALITTYSTTGYIVFFVLVIIYILQNKQFGSTKKFILVVISLVGIFYSYTSLDFLGDKINSDDGMSNGRILAYSQLDEKMENHLLLGNSFTEEATIGAGNGFLAFLSNVGIVGFAFYFIFLYRRLSYTFSSKNALLSILILMIMLQGEGFLSHPLFLALPCASYLLLDEY